ncbi:MAG: DNA repair protein RecN [Aquabacterium sp.]|jgi:DNA repair protein RecN (Recombination protein N)|uniref:DNA repair protein RecN n=1 Tax=Aquabacterium sp. TaxID=1872578 RepID=UPI002A36907E|nr:DNA repair protein RecN [Aquabacterium sp.]MDX9843829.1 DNA repair protein RecN [Aquabacterium sp.]
MLRRLTLRDFVIVTSLEVDLSGGFTALTGETGAGKSILIDALQLALGSRGDAGVVREGAARADITAEFEPSAQLTALLTPWLEEAGFDNLEPGAPLLLRRVVDAQGKSRAWINGSPATATQLRELGEHLVDIHGQHAWQSLTRADAVRALVDAQAGVDNEALQAAWVARREAARRLDEARSQQADLERERERLQWQIGELDKLSPQADEWETLNTEHGRLSHGQAILDAARLALDALSEADESAESLTARAIDALEDVASVEPHLGNALEVLREAQAQLQDAARSLNSALHHTELDPDRLAELDNHMSMWMSLARRYRRPAPELPELLQSWRDELAKLDAATDLEKLERDAEVAHQAWQKVAHTVSRQRSAAAPSLSHAVTEAMQELGMKGGRFEVALTAQTEPQAYGLENIEFLVAGHAGSTPRPLGKVASGGELSRLALAIAVTTSQCSDERSQVGTLIFDEIDSGVGGAVADTVGRLMQRLGRDRQVLAVTHLAQVAACAHQHLVVAKAVHDGQTTSDIGEVRDDERTTEVARMLGGQITDTSRAHAQAMLATAHAQDMQDAEAAPTAGKATRKRKEAA